MANPVESYRESFFRVEGGQERETGNLSRPEFLWKLPATFTPLIGREQEVADICALLQRSDVRLLTLLGTGGIGKTRLAIQVATALRAYFTDGICFIALAAISNPTLFIPTIAQELGIRETGESHLLTQVICALRSKNLLLVLDNFEQILNAAPELTELLAACAHLKILVTSRAVLHLQGEYDYPVPPLSVPNLKHLPEPEQLEHIAAVMLFIQRARAIHPAFQLNYHNLAVVAEICVRLDGLPLAIELAASRIKLLPPRSLLKKLERRFEILTSSAYDAPARHQTLQSTLAWSYDLLSCDEQQLFRHLSVFANGCTLEAIEHVENVRTATPDTSLALLERIASLMDKSLVQQIELESEEPRFVMLETLREYGQERLHEQQETQTIQRLHALYYLKLAEEAEPHLKTARQIDWLARLEQEQENLRSALGWFNRQGERELALRLCAALGWFWHLHGHWSEGRRWLEATLTLTTTGKPSAFRARVLHSAGDLAYYQDDYTRARSLLEESTALCRELGLTTELASSLSALGILMHIQGDSARARPLLEESEVICRNAGYTWELAYLLRRLAQRALQESDPSRAAALAHQGLTYARKLGDKFLIAITLGTSGDIAAYQGNLAQATVSFREALPLARALGDTSLTAIMLQNLGYIAALQGNLLEAAALTREGLLRFQELGDRMFLTAALHSLGYITALQGDLARAALLYREGLELAEEIGYETQVGSHLIGLAGVAEAQGHYQQATRLLGAAETRFDVHVYMNATERADYDRLLQRISAHLHEKMFKEAWAAGRSMTPQQALTEPEYIEARPAPPVARIEPPKAYPAGLTAREVEILCLVAQGLTDARVAEQLVISPRTVNWHLTLIYSKLGISSRSAATRFAIEQHLVPTSPRRS